MFDVEISEELCKVDEACENNKRRLPTKDGVCAP